jgi:hypothetical protein
MAVERRCQRFYARFWDADATGIWKERYSDASHAETY